jgi:hypothetical protein
MMRVLAVVATVAVMFIAGLLGYDAWRDYQLRRAIAEEREYRTSYEECTKAPDPAASPATAEVDRKLRELACDRWDKLRKARTEKALDGLFDG